MRLKELFKFPEQLAFGFFSAAAENLENLGSLQKNEAEKFGSSESDAKTEPKNNNGETKIEARSARELKRS